MRNMVTVPKAAKAVQHSLNKRLDYVTHILAGLALGLLCFSLYLIAFRILCQLYYGWQYFRYPNSGEADKWKMFVIMTALSGLWWSAPLVVAGYIIARQKPIKWLRPATIIPLLFVIAVLSFFSYTTLYNLDDSYWWLPDASVT